MALDIASIGGVKRSEPPQPSIYNKAYRHSIVESAYQNSTNLLTQVTGTPRLVEYYRSFVNTDEQPTAFSIHDAPTYQSYTRIKQVIIKQEGDGSYDYNAETGESSKNYSAYVTFGLVPGKYDVLIADIGDGRAGYFFVTEQPEILNFTADKVYRISFQLMGILTEEIFDALDKRVVQELVYSNDSALAGGTALITTKDFSLSSELNAWKGTIAEHILHNFYWNDERTLAYKAELLNQPVHNKQGMVYDHALVNFAKGVIRGDLLFGYPFINLLSIEYSDKHFGTGGNHNIFDLLLRMNFRALRQADNKAVLIDPRNLVSSRNYGNISSSKFDYVLILDKENYERLHQYYVFDGMTNHKIIPNEEIDYFFSDRFYEGGYHGKMEKLIKDIAIDRVINRDDLLEYCEEYFKLEPIKQLYHGVILIYLIELSRRFGPMNG